ncbi:SsgA family sporulation/cell division regulator [Streptomyces sp. ODS28]|uniref:SsgA family sporulation/cell division regulator n=1 Tax=Streptomyces sp. ODS28 TaxID=3136688 RepID=UPI0031F0CB53
MPTVIDHAVQARLIVQSPEARELTAALRYDAGDPFAVRIVFPSDASLDGTEVTWTFARELLDAGLRGPAGHGDVRIWPAGLGKSVVELHSSEGVAVLEFQGSDLREFLRCSYGEVPADQAVSQLDVDAGLEALLRGV